MRAFRVTFVLLLMAALAPCGAIAATLKRAPGPTEIVIYNDDLALVREPYALSLARGGNDLSLEGVPRRIDSTSVRLEGEGFRVLRQSFDYDLWSGDRVFRRFLGDTIRYRYVGKSFRGRLVGIEGDDLYIERRDSVGLGDLSQRTFLRVRHEHEMRRRLFGLCRQSLAHDEILRHRLRRPEY